MSRREQVPSREPRPPRRKRFGQHFLHDPNVLEQIVAELGPHANDRLVEIGPGRGALTRLLLDAGNGTLDAIEIDRDLVALLRAEIVGYPGFTLHEVDALEFDFTRLSRERGGKLRVIGNLPYNISTPLLFHLLKHRDAIEDLHIMLQKEVIERMAAQPNEDDYGRLTVMLAPWVTVERLFDVGPGAFTPPPRVWSAVARLTVRPEPAFAVSPHFPAIVAAAFSHRRKTLRNALRALVSLQQIESCGLDPGVRPETLAPQAFNDLARTLDGDTPVPNA
ncbi:MAG TPA: 16S rRNA (adenine(1518)-N(6)/adenine(1519)-N(6))-dimethyltransferase RsmA [Steroidobacteraceae bacterium]|nr:16S rRNA (adenine(1518)-N(6)/adenine(1519)-N(6))-dimethyltransferase RsmA [Steroidobacteraceae bacterium]